MALLTPSVIVALVVATLSFFSGRQWWSRRQLERLHGCQPCAQYPHKDLVGKDLYRDTMVAMMSGKGMKFRQSLYQTYGKTFRARFWTETRMYTMDLKNLQTILALDFESYGVEVVRMPTSGHWLGRGIFTTDGAFWRHSRNSIKPIFARAQISNLQSFAKHVDRLINLLPTDGSTVDLQPLFLRLYLDHSTEFLFGESANTLDPDPHRATIDADTFVQSFDDALQGVGRLHALGKWLRIFARYNRDFVNNCRESQKFVETCVEKAIDRRFSKGSQQDNEFVFVDELLKQTSDRRYLRDQLLNMFFPARDSSAIGISLVFFQLARHPTVWSKVRAEVLEETGALSLEKLKSFKYLQATLNEALRLHAPAGQARRTCIKDTILPHGGGESGMDPILVTKGTQLQTDWDLMHRDSDIWGPDAGDFRPERWSEIKPPQWEYMPFMGGPRICPAQQWILTQYAYIIVRFARLFESLKNRDPEERLIEEMRMTKRSRNGVKVGLQRS